MAHIENRSGILSAVGNTPLVRLNTLPAGIPVSVFAKLEGVNPAGSIKDRAALNIIEDAISKGLVRAGGVVIESSSGNMAIALAQACICFGLRLICVVDLRMTPLNLKILEAYGAHAEMIMKPDPTTGDFLTARLKRVRELLDIFPDAFWPDQYSNTANSDAHRVTMSEIVESVSSKIDYLFCSTSTCGTLRGCAEYVRAHEMKTQIYAVDAIGSVIFADAQQKSGEAPRRLIPGHGASVRPALFRGSLASRFILVSDLDCIVGCRRLVRSEGILAGGSSGGVVAAFERVKHEMPAESVCVLIFPDRGERYIDTIYSDAWVYEKFGETARIMENPNLQTVLSSAQH